MDMQMPELDGIGATRALRADACFAKIPIIAMTANAMKAELDACLAAGMNDYVTKPIDRKALVDTLRRWLPHRIVEASPAATAAAQPAPSATPATTQEPEVVLQGFDFAATLHRLGIDRDTLERMLLRFADGQQDLLKALRAAVVAGDGALAAKHAHAIAGASGNFGANALSAAAKSLEHAGRAGSGANLGDLLAAVEEQTAIVLRSIESLRAVRTRNTDAGAGVFNPALAAAALDRLAGALERYDLSAARAALSEVVASHLPSWAADDLERLRQCVDGYEYDGARDVAARLLAGVHSARV